MCGRCCRETRCRLGRFVGGCVATQRDVGHLARSAASVQARAARMSLLRQSGMSRGLPCLCCPTTVKLVGVWRHGRGSRANRCVPSVGDGDGVCTPLDSQLPTPLAEDTGSLVREFHRRSAARWPSRRRSSGRARRSGAADDVYSHESLHVRAGDRWAGYAAVSDHATRACGLASSGFGLAAAQDRCHLSRCAAL